MDGLTGRLLPLVSRLLMECFTQRRQDAKGGSDGKPMKAKWTLANDPKMMGFVPGFESFSLR